MQAHSLCLPNCSASGVVVDQTRLLTLAPCWVGVGGATSFQPGLPCTPLPGGMMVQRPWWGSWEVLCWSSGLTLYAFLSLSLSPRPSPEQFKRPTRLPVCPWELPTPQHQPQPREPRRPPRQGARAGPLGRRGRGSTKVGLPLLPPLREARPPLWGWQDACPPDLGVRGWVRVLGESPKWHSGSPSWLTGLLLLMWDRLARGPGQDSPAAGGCEVQDRKSVV